MDKDDLLNNIQRHWNELTDFIAPLSPSQMLLKDAGGWTIKDNLAHISEWERFLMANQFEGKTAAQAMGVPPEAFEKLDEAGYNAIILTRNLDRSLIDVLSGLTDTHARLIERLASLTEEDLHKFTICIGAKPEEVMTWVIYNTYQHYAEHLRTIKPDGR